MSKKTITKDELFDILQPIMAYNMHLHGVQKIMDKGEPPRYSHSEEWLNACMAISQTIRNYKSIAGEENDNHTN